MKRRRLWQIGLSVGVAGLAVAGAMLLPTPKSSSPGAANGPARLTDQWPKATVFTFPSMLPDGSSYQPMLIFDATSSVGIATSADLATTRFVLRSGPSGVRELRVLTGESRPTVAATSLVGDRLYWLEITASGEAEGPRQTSLWGADVHSGPARKIASDSSDPLYFDSAYDLQVAGGQARWAANAPGDSGTGELRSVSLEGGTVTGRPLDRLFALTAWPWATSSAANLAGSVELLNLETGERKTVPAGPDQILTCTPVWCRVTTLVDQGQRMTFEVEHVDGKDRRAIGDGSLTPLNTDVALLDRFEVVASMASTNSQRLWLQDLMTNKLILLDESVTSTVGSRRGYLWWSTGDNETLTWHVLDLRTLN